MRIWWFLVLKGLLLLVVGLLFIFDPEEAIIGVSFYIGLILLAAGIIGIASIPRKPQNETKLLTYMAPFVALIAGIILIFFAEYALLVFALTAGIWLFVDGIEHLNTASAVSKIDKGMGRWMIFMGILSILIAVLIFLNPMSLVTIMTQFFGIILLISGIFTVILGLRLR